MIEPEEENGQRKKAKLVCNYLGCSIDDVGLCVRKFMRLLIIVTDWFS